MVYSTWKIWARTLILFHVCALLVASILFVFTAFSYVFLAFSTISLWAIGLIIGDVFGHREFKSQLISRGMTIISTISTTAVIGLLAASLASKTAVFQWIQMVIFWICFFLPLVYGFLMIVLFFTAKVQAQVPKGWSFLCLVLGALFILTGLSTLLIPMSMLLFQITGMLSVVVYLIWGFWFAFLLTQVDRV